MYFDQHLHSHHSPDGYNLVVEMAEGARKAGCSGITITDHCNFKKGEPRDLYTPLKNCFEELEELRKTYDPDFFLGFGTEIGQGNQDIEGANEAAKWFPYDAVLGSVHFVEGQTDYCTWENVCPEPLKEMEKYFLAELEITEKTDFDILAHLTYPWRYFENNPDFPKPYDYPEITDKIFRTIIEKGRAIEINISGVIRNPHFNCMPTLELARRYRELGGEYITIGSDAHVDWQCGHCMKEATEFLKEAGFKYLAHFRKRKPVMIKL